MELIPGSEIDRYVVVRRLGAGGNGVVYLARHRELGTAHAIKLLRNSAGTDRLRREGRLQATLDHPNVVRVTDTVTVGDELGLVMEYVEGPTLGEWMTTANPSLDQIDAVARAILDAVAVAHERGWVHRDLKPANVLMKSTATGVTPKVTDFGLARVLGEDGIGAGASTRSGLGTVGYMSLEQISGAPASPDMDVFALGVVLFELVEGGPAFATTNDWRRALRSGRYPSPGRADLPDRMRSAVRSALCDVMRRIRDARGLMQVWTGELSAEVAPTAAPVTLSEDDTVDADQILRPTSSDGVGVEPGPARLPSERDTFVGREEDLADLAARLRAGDRLVTIHGPGGIGKTRVVVRYAWSGVRAWPGGTWFCDLSAARTRDDVLRAVATVLDVPLEADDPVGQLARAIAARGRCLVVLDNFEQVVEHASATVGAWMDAATDAVFVATSRVVLGLQSERVIRIEPLSEDDAVALFADRAVATRRDFDAAEHDAGIRRLVARLDGIPLAIELCAARVRLLTPAQIEERMGNRFLMLTGGRGRPDRQVTLRATLEWSWDLLEDAERRALAQCSVFAGGFPLDALEAVIDVSAWPGTWVVDLFQALVDKSWVRARADRFELLGSIQDFASEQLGEAGSAARTEAERRHGLWMVGRATESSGARPMFEELDNLMVAADRAIHRGELEVAARVTIAAVDVLLYTGPAITALTMLDRVRSFDPSGPFAPRLDSALGNTYKDLGRIVDSLVSFDRALARSRERGDRRTEAVALLRLGIVRADQGRVDEALQLYADSLVLSRALGMVSNEGMALSNIGVVLKDLGRLDEAETHYRAALALHQECGGVVGEAVVLGNLAILAGDRGRYAEAVTLLQSSLAVHTAMGNRRRAAWVHGNLGHLFRELGRDEDARLQFDEAVAAARSIGDVRLTGLVMGNAAIVSEQLRPAEAEAQYAKALQLIRQIGDRRFEGIVLGNLARFRAAAGRSEDVRPLFMSALELLRAARDAPMEGVVLGQLGAWLVSTGEPDAGREAFDASEALLRRANASPVDLAKLLCRRAELSSDAAQRERWLSEARGIASMLELPPSSILAREILRVAGAPPP